MVFRHPPLNFNQTRVPGMAGSQTADKKVDLRQIIEDYALNIFSLRASKKEKKLLEKKYIELSIDWKKVIFEKDPPVYDPEPQQTGKPTSNVLFSTSFMNKTNAPQKYSFRAERVTHSSCTVAVDRAVTTGMEMNVTLQTPCEIFQANAGFKREMTVTTNEQQTVDEELSWSVDSEIEVKASHIADAKLTVLEEKYDGAFTMVTKIGGFVTIVFTNRKENNSFITSMKAQITEIVRDYIEKQRKINAWQSDVIMIDKQLQRVVCTTSGKCEFKYGIKQLVEVDQKPIDGKVL